MGLIPEFVGRLPILVTLEALNEEALVNILTQPKKCAGEAVSAAFGIGWREADL